MKNLIILFLCLILALSFSSCGAVETNDENDNRKAREVLQKVLSEEENFTYKCMVFGKVTEENLSNFKFNTEDQALKPFVLSWYTYTDFDADGIDELLLADMGLNSFLVLRYDNEKVNGYIIEDISMKDVKTDGSFLISRYNSYSAICKISFDGLDYKVTNLAYKDDSKGIYQLSGKDSNKKEVQEYFDDWNKRTTSVSWTKTDKQPTGLKLDDGSMLYDQTDSIGNIEFKDENGTMLLDSADVSVLYLKSMPDYGYYVQVEFTNTGKEKFAKATRENIGKVITVLAKGEVISEPRVVDEITDGETIFSGFESYEKAAAAYDKMKK